MSGRRQAAAVHAEVVIERLGRDGDGVAIWQGQPLFVPFTLPGERVRVQLTQRGGGRLSGWVTERITPPLGAPPVCRHFGTCGGCRLQHLPAELYRQFRLWQVTSELERRHLAFPKPAFVAVPAGSRRRLRLAWRTDGRVHLGFRRLRGHAVIDIAECPVARPELVALLPALRRLLEGVGAARGEGEAILLALPKGVDLLLRLPSAPDLADRERLAALARAHGLVRVAIGVGSQRPEPVSVLEPVEIDYGGVRVPVPAGAFLQATAEGEAALQAMVARWVRPRARLLDLFAGLGALSLPVKDRLMRLRLVDSEAAAVSAVTAAIRRVGAAHVEVDQRDLDRQPLPAAALAAFDVVLLDPPRAGAAAQVREIAASAVTQLVYVSCNPASFARDARVLADAGFDLRELAVIDQFLWSSEVELAAYFERSPESAGASARVSTSARARPARSA